MARSTVCEIQRPDGWYLCEIEEALRRGERHGRCPECQGPVQAYQGSGDGTDAHFAHSRANARCALNE